MLNIFSRSGFGLAILRRRGAKEAFLLFCVVVLGLALRLFRISEQSVWMDEYFAMIPLSDLSWDSYWAAVRFFMPDNMPLAYAIHYGFAELIGSSLTIWMRVLHVVFGVCCIPLVYLAGRNAYSKNAGLVAAFLAAVSPVHLWTAQDLRPNVIVELFAAFSMLSLSMGLSSNRKIWWFANVAANVCVVWTHLFGIFLIAAESCLMVFYIRSHFKRTFLWGAAQFAIGLSVFLWLPLHLGVSDTEEDFWRSKPKALEAAIDLLGDDAVMTSEGYMFQGQTWSFLSEEQQESLFSLHGRLDAAMMAFFGLCVVWAFARIVRSIYRVARGSGSVSEHEALLLFIALLPALLLYFGSLYYRPMMLTRYTSYSSFGLYVLAGGLLVSVRRSWLRRFLFPFLVVLYAYQLSFALPAKTRSDWRSAINYIRANGAPDDIVLTKGTFGSCDLYRYNASEIADRSGWHGPPAVPAYTLESVVRKSDRFLSDGSSRNAVWALVEPFAFSIPPIDSFESCLASSGLAYSRKDFPGMSKISVYRVTRGSPLKTPCHLKSETDYAGLLSDMGFSEGSGGEYEEALSQLRSVVDAKEWPQTKVLYMMLTFMMCDEGFSELATRAAACCVRRDPGYAFGHFASSVAAYESGDLSSGEASFERAVSCDKTGYFIRYRPLLDALYHGGGQGQDGAGRASFLVSDMEKKGGFLPHSLRVRAGLAPRIPVVLPGAGAAGGDPP